MVGGSGHNGRLGTYKTVGMAETVGSIHIKEAWKYEPSITVNNGNGIGKKGNRFGKFVVWKI